MKTPEHYTNKDWANYMFRAYKRELGVEWKPVQFTIQSITRMCNRRIKDGIDPYLVAMKLDLLAFENNVSDETFVVDQLQPWLITAPFFERKRGLAFWRAVWYSRFADTDHQIEFYRHWLRQYEFAYELANVNEDKIQLLVTCKKQFAMAEKKIKTDNSKPVFKFHWLREFMTNEIS